MIIACPQCRKPAAYDETNPYRPFCSERCKLIDLGTWASEGYAIAGEPAGPRPEADPAGQDKGVQLNAPTDSPRAPRRR